MTPGHRGKTALLINFLTTPIFLFVTASASAQAWVAPRGTGSVSIDFSRFFVQKHTDFKGHPYYDKLGNRFDFGKVRSNTAIASLDYSFNDGAALTIGLPYINSVYHGHEPESSIDDGQYHGTLQDFRIALRYMALRSPVVLTPFATAVIPSRNYETLGHTAAGRHLNELLAGFYAARQLTPIAPDVFVQLKYSYARVQRLEDMRLDRSNVVLDLEYIVTSRLSVGASSGWQRMYGGIDFTNPYDTGGHPVQVHDRLARENYLYLVSGATWRASRSTDLYGGVIHVIRSENAHQGTGILFGMRLSFGGPSTAAMANSSSEDFTSFR